MSIEAAGTIERVNLFLCGVCHQPYALEHTAKACAAQENDIRLEVGDFVTLGFHYGWFNGDEAWVYQRRPKGPRDTATVTGEFYAFYYAVTAITQKQSRQYEPWKDGSYRVSFDPSKPGPGHYYPHQTVYHLVTKAMQGEPGTVHGEGKPWRVWTVASGHLTPQKVETPALDVAGLIGLQGKTLA